MLLKYVCTIILLIYVTRIEALRVLVVFPLPSKSHSILGQGVASRLLEAGHEVLHITSFPRDKPVTGLKEIDVSIIGKRLFHKSEETSDAFKLKNLIGKGMNFLLFQYISYDFSRQLLEERVVLDFLSDTEEHFDVVILEWFFSEVTAGIASLFQCPLIWFSPTEAHWQILNIIDDIPNPAYSVDMNSANRPPLSYWERVEELWTIVKKFLIINLLSIPFEKTLYNNVYPSIGSKRGITVPSYDEAVHNGSLLLLNSHPTIGTAFRLPQNAKYVGGYHISKEVKPLPEDLQILMDEAKHGVIYFSMGSNLKSADMSVEMRDSLLTMFGQLKQTVIWKFEEDLPNVSSNIHLVKWAPQLSILSHPNLKMFVTHGGQLSTTEAIHFGVPVVGIPVIGDQFINMKSVVDKGLGILVTLAEDIAVNLKNAIEELLKNPNYKQRAKQVSRQFHDRIVPPGEELVHWVEYVVRTGGAFHLRSPAIGVPLYQKLYLDFIIVLITAIYLLIKIVKTIRRMCLNSKSNKLKRY